MSTRLTIRQGFLSPLIFLLLSTTVLARSDPSMFVRTLVLSPEWSLVFHLLVFFLIFLGILVRPLQERLGRPGAAVAAGFALLLSTSLALTGRFHLLDLEPLAAIGLFALLGGIVAAGFRRLYAAGWTTTLAIGVMTGYGAMRLASPRLTYLAGDALVINEVVYAAAFVWLAYRLIALILAENPATWFSHASRLSTARGPHARQRLKQSAEAAEALAAAAEREAEDHHVILAELDETARALHTYKNEPGLNARIRDRLTAIAHAARHVETEFQRYQTLVDRVEHLDAEEYAALREEFDQLPLQAKAEALQELNSLRAKLTTDAIQRRLANAIQANTTTLQDALQRATTELQNNNTKACLRALNDAQKAEHEAARLTAQINRFAQHFKDAATRVVTQTMTKAAQELKR